MKMDKNIEKQLDYVYKINMYFTEKNNKEILKESGIHDKDSTFQKIMKISKKFDEIYKEMNEKYPLMWYEYGFNGNDTNN